MQSLRLFLGFLNPSIYKSLDLGKLPAPPRAAAVQPKSLKQTPFHACRGQRPRFCCLCEYDLSLSCVSFCSGNLVPGEVILDTAGSTSSSSTLPSSQERAIERPPCCGFLSWHAVFLSCKSSAMMPPATKSLPKLAPRYLGFPSPRLGAIKSHFFLPFFFF